MPLLTHPLTPWPLLAGLLLPMTGHALAPIAVQSYSGPDGPYGFYGYDDQTYSGSRAGGLLSGGTGDLTDGVVGGSVGSGYWNWSPYVMWDGVSPVLTLDLGTEHLVQSVQTSLIAYPSAAVYIPTEARLRFSTNGVDYGPEIVRTFSAAERALGNDATPTYELLSSGAASGRYLQLTLVSAGRWTGLSEVTLLGSAAAVPEPTPLALLAAGLSLLAWRRRRPAG
ncbi:PEP-CTERM sorting domain-containing protein [Ideonella livida]|uniref:PEP-CTERM sorting domain-containing protein n=1 Tax=Ideonella livida TaxID=2707176 RepID=A0A7C9TNY3_9BURK|nr:PEP-CTERM sorting domain-containing protein [Ideonella livida]NDY92986.1 PEP-CTERM sorting domain-containing protein [Ideonella livida]